MVSGSYRFKLGTFECTALLDGEFDYPLESLFATAPQEILHADLRARGLPVDHITTPYTFVHVDTGEHRVMVDMGAGALGPRTGKLTESMRNAGLDPTAVDIALITHAHPDHVGGAVSDDGTPIFPNATHFLSRSERDFWFSEEAWARAPENFVRVARARLQQLSGVTTLLGEEIEIVPGLKTIAAPGHTPGHTIMSVTSEGQEFLYTSDTALSPLHLDHPDWYPAFDVDPPLALETKRRIFDYAAQRQALVMAQHFAPFPALGRVERRGDGWAWLPVD